jgi:surface antigen
MALLLVASWVGTAALPQQLAAQVDPDEEYVGPLINQALEGERTGVEIPWSNPATGSGGMIVIERTFYRDPRTPCRDYRRTTERAGGPKVEIQGTGCRVGSDRWSLDEESPATVAAGPAPVASSRQPPGTPPAPEPERAAAAPPNCPALTAVPVPCSKPAAVVDYTMPTKTEL